MKTKAWPMGQVSQMGQGSLTRVGVHAPHASENTTQQEACERGCCAGVDNVIGPTQLSKYSAHCVATRFVSFIFVRTLLWSRLRV